MAIVNKQTMKPPAQPAKKPFVPIKGQVNTQQKKPKSAWELPETIKIMLYGRSGTGKTTLWSTFPGPICACITSNIKSTGELRSIDTPEMRNKITPYIIKESSELTWILENAASEGFKTIVLDHVTGMQDLILKEVTGLDKIPEQKNWGVFTREQYGQAVAQAKEYLRLALDLPLNTVIIGQERVFNSKDEGNDDEQLKPLVGADTSPALGRWLNPTVDYLLQCFIRPKYITKEIDNAGKKVKKEVRVEGEVEYCVRCEPHETFMTKFRSTVKYDQRTKVIINPDYNKIMKAIKGN